MQYTVIYKEKSYDLPKKTINIMSKIDEVIEKDNIDIDIKEKYQSILDFIGLVLDKKNIIEILGTDDLEDIDLSELAILFLEIKNSYEKPVNDYNIKVQSQVLNNEMIDKITRLSASIEGLNKASKND